MSFATSPSNAVASLIAVLIMAAVHVFVGELRRVNAAFQSAVLMAAAGSSLAYVLVHIVPKLADKQEILLSGVEPGVLGYLEHHVYLMAMAGLVLYYAFSRIAVRGADGETPASRIQRRAALISTVTGYAAYSLLIGYLVVHRLRPEFFSLVLITTAMITHFVISDHGLRHQWPEAYDRMIRWVLAIALVAGWALGAATEISPQAIATWFAFLAGGMLIITIREELPSEQSGSFWAFLVGVVAYTGLLLVIEQMPKGAH